MKDMTLHNREEKKKHDNNQLDNSLYFVTIASQICHKDRYRMGGK